MLMHEAGGEVDRLIPIVLSRPSAPFAGCEIVVPIGDPVDLNLGR